MLSITKNNEKDRSAWRFFSRSARNEVSIPILEKLAASLNKELKLRLRQINSSSDKLSAVVAIQMATDNLTNVKLTVEKTIRTNNLLGGEAALILLDRQIEQTTAVLQSEIVFESAEASATGVRTLNLLFCARQMIKRKFSIITPVTIPAEVSYNGQTEDKTRLRLLSSDVDDGAGIPRMVIDSTILYQLHHSLFPAERMMVGAGSKKGRVIEIDGIFDVTGNASSGYVRADADRLARALIVMSETRKYFALWIHSHPGRGCRATHPSSTDTNQEAEWLKDYSPDLVSAIMVEDRFIRFWGKALEEKRLIVEINGTGVRRASEIEEIYQLEF